MPGLGWGEKDNMTAAERKAAKKLAEDQMRAQKAAKAAKAAKAPKGTGTPRHANRKGLW